MKKHEFAPGCHGHPAPGAGALVMRTCPLRAATASSTCSIPRHSGRQQEQRRAVRSAEHGGKDRAVALDPLQHLAALPDPDNGALRRIRRLDPHGALGVHADAGPRPSAQTRRLDRLPSVSMSNAAKRPPKDSEMISVELSGVITMPFGNARSSATVRAEPS